jgi:hypothetical protein
MGNLSGARRPRLLLLLLTVTTIASCAPDLDFGPPPPVYAGDSVDAHEAAFASVAEATSGRPEPRERRTAVDRRKVFRLRASAVAIEILGPLRSELEALTDRELVFETDSDRGAAHALADELCDVSVFAGPLTRRDRERGLRAEVLGYHVLTAVVCHRNPVAGITRHALQEVLAGTRSNWMSIGSADWPVEVFTLPDGNPLAILTASLTLAADPLTPDAVPVWNWISMAARIEATPGGIALLPLASVNTSQLRVLPVDGVFPSLHAARDGSYPFVVPIVVATHGASDVEAATVVQCLMSAAGQGLRSRVLTL